MNQAYSIRSIISHRLLPMKIAVWVVLMLGFGSVKAQFYSKRYSATFGTNGYTSSIQISRDTIYAMCYFGDTAHVGSFIAGLAKFNKKGDLINMNPFSLPNKINIGANFNTLIKTKDGGFAYGGSTSDGHLNSIYILKYDRYGVFQWYKEIPDSNYSTFYCNRLMQDSFSNYYLTGSFVYLSNIRTDIYLAKTDSSGNFIYKKEYPYLFSSLSYGLSSNKKGNIVIGGDAFDYSPFDYNSARDYLEIYELDTAGNPLNHYLGTDTNGPQAYNIFNADDGGYMIANSYFCYRDRYKVKWQGSISKLDSNFHKVWEIDLGPCSQYTGFYAQTKCTDGNYIAVGIWHDDADTINNHRNGWIIKYSEDGHIIWNKLYRGASGLYGDDNRLLSIGFLSDSTIICAGQSLNNDDAVVPQRGWLLHLDTAGCLPDSNSCGIINGVQVVQAANESVKLYPNPATDHAILLYYTQSNTMNQVEMYDVTGRLVWSATTTGPHGTLPIDVSGMSAGMYTVRFTADGRLLMNEKLVVVR